MSSMLASVTASSLHIGGGEIILPPNAIVVVTGPNNSGKSTFLAELHRNFKHYGRQSYSGLIIDRVDKAISGDFADLVDFLEQGDFLDADDGKYYFAYGKSYKRETLEKAWEAGDPPWVIEETFVASLDPKNRLSRRTTYAGQVEVDPLDALWDNEAEEIRISQIFNRAFGTDLILDRSRGSGEFRIGDRKRLPPHKKRLSKDFRKLLDSFKTVDVQGDGMRSFASIALDLLTARKSLTVIDEPELFLHPPQIKQLARLICEETPDNAQVFVATSRVCWIHRMRGWW